MPSSTSFVGEGARTVGKSAPTVSWPQEVVGMQDQDAVRPGRGLRCGVCRVAGRLNGGAAGGGRGEPSAAFVQTVQRFVGGPRGGESSALTQSEQRACCSPFAQMSHMCYNGMDGRGSFARPSQSVAERSRARGERRTRHHHRGRPARGSSSTADIATALDVAGGFRRARAPQSGRPRTHAGPGIAGTRHD